MPAVATDLMAPVEKVRSTMDAIKSRILPKSVVEIKCEYHLADHPFLGLSALHFWGTPDHRKLSE